MVYWHWLILGGVFLIIEILSFTAFFLFFSIAAFLMALLTLSFPTIGLNTQLLIGSALAIISCIIWYKIFKTRNIRTEDINNRLDQYIGQTETLLEDVKNGHSKIKVGDTSWRVQLNGEGKKGEKIEITGHISTTFIAKLIK
jgi:hypothetical protein